MYVRAVALLLLGEMAVASFVTRPPGHGALVLRSAEKHVHIYRNICTCIGEAQCSIGWDEVPCGRGEEPADGEDFRQLHCAVMPCHAIPPVLIPIPFFSFYERALMRKISEKQEEARRQAGGYLDVRGPREASDAQARTTGEAHIDDWKPQAWRHALCAWERGHSLANAAHIAHQVDSQVLLRYSLARSILMSCRQAAPGPW